jgi:hypothetical protein
LLCFSFSFLFVSDHHFTSLPPCRFRFLIHFVCFSFPLSYYIFGQSLSFSLFMFAFIFNLYRFFLSLSFLNRSSLCIFGQNIMFPL